VEKIVDLAGSTPGPHVFLPNVSLSKLFDRILQRAGIPKKDELGHKLTAHSFRHTYATWMGESPEISAFALQKMLGHSKMETTAIYFHGDPVAKVVEVSDLLEGGVEQGVEVKMKNRRLRKSQRVKLNRFIVLKWWVVMDLNHRPLRCQSTAG
jgi:hypothetical protein